MKLTVLPLTPDRWPDIEAVFNAKGCTVARGCWCMAYRRSVIPFVPPAGVTSADANRADLQALVDSGKPPGLIGYSGAVPVGWISLAPRDEFKRLENSLVMKAVDEQPVWSIICFVVPSQYRGQGVAAAMLKGAVAHARKQGAKLLEAYPMDFPGRSSNDSMWFGAKSMFDAEGFEEVARRRPRHPIVRLKLRR